jgi:hypothetical protein
MLLRGAPQGPGEDKPLYIHNSVNWNEDIEYGIGQKKRKIPLI